MVHNFTIKKIIASKLICVVIVQMRYAAICNLLIAVFKSLDSRIKRGQSRIDFIQITLYRFNLSIQRVKLILILLSDWKIFTKKGCKKCDDLCQRRLLG